ncbi:MAG: molybdopterin-binding protein [Xanthobacteraceae bacterium]|nr:molybdopterin-binding protein [Xanthobacteraceae bacterium]
MTGPQRLTTPLISLETARRLLLAGCEPVAALERPVTQALGCIAAENPPFDRPYPVHDIASRDGWAVRTQDIVGASPYSPVHLRQPPIWVELGDRLPPGCDCVLDPDSVDQAGPLVQVIAEVIPGAGVRRTGHDVAHPFHVIAEGMIIRPVDVLIARSIGLEKLAVRRPSVRIVNVPVHGLSSTAGFIADAARAAGGDVVEVSAAGRDAASIADVFDAGSSDLMLIVGGTGTGRADAAIEALATRGTISAHGVALQPGQTAAIGNIQDCPVLVLPGSWDHALAVWLTLARPALDRLSGRIEPAATALPLARKISSAPGITEIVLLKHERATWIPLSTGELSFDRLSSADAWLAVPGESEGYASGAVCSAFPLRDI